MDTLILKEFELLNTSTAPSVKRNQSDIHKDFENRCRIEIVKRTDKDLEFDLIGVDPSLANAFRRLMISDVPSMAIEKVYIYNNTSIIQDEVLAHRLGLIPINADPKLFEWKKIDDTDQGDETNTLEFELKIRCSKKKNSIQGSTDPDDLYENHRVLTECMKWIPKGNQLQRMKDIGPVETDILIAKLRPGHEIDIKMYAVKGIGRDHAKFSPVCTAFYRLLPRIELKETIVGDSAVRLQKCFSPGVIGIDKKKRAFVKDARYDMCSRNALRYEDFKDTVELSKVKDHFIFTVESVGAIKPEDIFLQSVDILAEKCDYFLNELKS